MDLPLDSKPSTPPTLVRASGTLTLHLLLSSSSSSSNSVSLVPSHSPNRLLTVIAPQTVLPSKATFNSREATSILSSDRRSLSDVLTRTLTIPRVVLDFSTHFPLLTPYLRPRLILPY